MTIDNTPDSGQDAAGEHDDTPTTPRRRRRATRPAASPEPATDTATADTTAGEGTTPQPDSPPADDTPAATDAPPKARRSRRRAAAPEQSDEASVASDGDTPTEADGGTLAASDELAPPARRTRSRRAKATADAEPATGDGPTTDGPDVTEPEGEPEAAAPRSRRRRRAEPAPEAVEPAPAEQPDDEQPDDEAPAEEQPQETAGTSGGKPVLATTALLFQPPDPTSRPRRRRAQAPAGPPKPLEDEPTDELLEEPTDEPVDDDETTGSRSTEPVAEESAEDRTEDGDGSNRDDDGSSDSTPRRRRRRGGRGRRRGNGNGDQDGDSTASDDDASAVSDDTAGERPDTARDGEDAADGGDSDDDGGSSSSRRRRRRRRSRGERSEESRGGRSATDEVTALKGSTRLEAKRQRRREGRESGRRRSVVTEAEFLARREAVERSMVVRQADGRVQIAVLEDGVLVEHYVSRSGGSGQSSMTGNVYLGRVQNVLPSMEAAFVDIGRGRNAVLYAGEVNWDAAGLEGQPRRIEQALKSGDSVLVQVTKDPIGHKGARLTSQVTLAGRFLVYVPGGGMTGISRKLPDTERSRLKKLLKEIVPEDAGVIVRTAAEGASDEELRRDVERLQEQWAAIQKKQGTASAPALLQGEPDLAIRVVRDIFNDDFRSLVVQGDDAHTQISDYLRSMAPDLAERVSRWTEDGDVFAAHRVDEQLAKGMDRKVWLPSGGSLVIDRTEAMTVIDVNTGKFTGAGGTLEETVTRNNLEAAEEIVRQLRLRDIGGIIVIDFIDMVLESNRDLVLRRLVECLGRDRTKHQVAEVTSLGLVQMTRKRVGQGLVEAFSETCEHCNGRGFLVHAEPVEPRTGNGGGDGGGESKRSRRKKGSGSSGSSGSSAAGGQQAAAAAVPSVPVLPEAREAVKATLATIAAAAAHAHDHDHEHRQGSASIDVVLPDGGTVQVTAADVADAAAAQEPPQDGSVQDGSAAQEPAAEPVEHEPAAEPVEHEPARQEDPAGGH